jgi:hypothetical protein
MVIQLSKYFKEDKLTYQKEGITLYQFDETMIVPFIQECIEAFRTSYVKDEQLDYEVNAMLWTREEAIKARLPQRPQIQSGDFGEILIFHIAKEVICSDANILPFKWRWKENRDTSSHLTDVILLKCDDEQNPQSTDYLHSFEVKSYATPIKEKEKVYVMNQAIHDACKDKSSRIAKTITYLLTEYAKEKDTDKARLVKRFEDAATVPYQINISAAIVVEKDSLNVHIQNITAKDTQVAVQEGITLFAVPIKDMKRIYQEIYNSMPTKG